MSNLNELLEDSARPKIGVWCAVSPYPIVELKNHGV